jgi:hypothetical protein
MTLEAQTAPAAADTGPLTIDQAADIIAAKSAPAPEPKKRAKAPAAAVESDDQVDLPDDPERTERVDALVEEVDELIPDSEAAPQAADDGEEAPETDTLDAEQEQATDPATPKLEAPARWDAEAKEVFATLPPKAQATILAREKLQQAEVTKAQQKSAEAVKAVETRIQHLNTLATQIGENYVEPGQAAMKAWHDWFASPEAQELAQADPGAFLSERMRYEKEGRELQAAIKAKSDAEQTAFVEYAKEQAKLIPELVPELADETEGPKLKSELFSYLRAEGFEADRLRGISAKEVQIGFKAKKLDDLNARFAKDGGIDALVRDAEKYRKSMALLNKAPPPKPKPQAGPSAPATGQGQRLSSSEARLKTLSTKPSLSADEHTELMMLKAKSRK